MDKRAKITIAAVTLILMMPFLILPTSAMTPIQTSWHGSATSGAVMPEGSSIILENQSIRFDISDFPDFQNDEGYSAKVETEYGFYNPTDSEITLKMVYPIGKEPSYQPGVLGTIDPTKYSVKVNGESVDATLRHGFDTDYLYDPYAFASGLSDDFIDKGILTPNTTVTKYIFKQSGVKPNYAYVGFDIRESDLELNGSCLYFGEYSRAWDLDYENGAIRVNSITKENGDLHTLYVFGGDLEKLPEWKFYKGADVEDGTEIEGEMEFVKKETTTLSDFVFTYYDESLGISEVDWYNMAVTELSLTIENDRVFTYLPGLNNNFNGYTVRGLVYELTVKPGERVNNVLTSPIYPSVDEGYEPTVYTYQYIININSLIPVNKIDVTVNTSSYIINDYDLGCEKVEGGYRLSIDPTEMKSQTADKYIELAFDLCEAENPEATKPKVPTILWILLILFLPIVLVIAVINLVGDGVEFVINKMKEIIK